MLAKECEALGREGTDGGHHGCTVLMLRWEDKSTRTGTVHLGAWLKVWGFGYIRDQPCVAALPAGRIGAHTACGGITDLPTSFLEWPTQTSHQPASAKCYQENHSVHFSQLIRSGHTPHLLSQAIAESFPNPAFELHGYCRLQWVY